MSQPLKVPSIVAKSERKTSLINFGAIGYGYWGPNVVRNLDGLEGARILAIADKSPAARERAQTSRAWRSGYGGCERSNLLARHRRRRHYHSRLDAL